MQAVILAAGLGSRLTSASGGKAKALVDIGGRPLILHQLEALADHGVGPVMVVVGHQADELQRVIGDRAEIILNDRFAETNSLYSLWLAREWVTGPFVLLNCDLFFDPLILDQLLEEAGNVLVYDSTSSRGREQTKVALKQRRVVDLGKDLPANSARGESLGMLKFEADGARAMLDTADHLIRAGNNNAWVIEATRAVCNQVPIFGVNIAGQAWAEIDFPYDLDVARREVWPQIWRGRWRRQVYWKRTRWLALVGAAAGLAFLGWLADALIGPGSQDWETVPVAGQEALSIDRDGKSQRWWEVGLGTTAVAEVSGSEAAVEVRLILPDTTTDSLQYVVSVAVDGGAEDWRALTATRDSAVHIDGEDLGDRDRIALELAPGRHQVAVTLAAGHATRMLVRVRQPEQRQD